METLITLKFTTVLVFLLIDTVLLFTLYYWWQKVKEVNENLKKLKLENEFYISSTHDNDAKKIALEAQLNHFKSGLKVSVEPDYISATNTVIDSLRKIENVDKLGIVEVLDAIDMMARDVRVKHNQNNDNKGLADDNDVILVASMLGAYSIKLIQKYEGTKQF